MDAVNPSISLRGRVLIQETTNLGSELSVHRIRSKVKHRSMSSNIKDSIVIFCIDFAQLLCVCELGFDGIGVQELDTFVICERLCDTSNGFNVGFEERASDDMRNCE